MTTFALSPDQLAQANALVKPTLRFLNGQDYLLGSALVRYCWTNGPAEDVMAGLGPFQNDDGGFGRGLEVDIKAPVSNPFAARLAMHVMLSVPLEASASMRERLKTWLVENQHEDGDWHFAPEVYEGRLPPWFAGWEFPSLNPTCCVAGAAKLLDITTPDMLQRVATLFSEKASLDEASSGHFYPMLPYVEYATAHDVPDHDAYSEAIADGILKADTEEKYEDAQHFFDHALNGGPDLLARTPADVIGRRVDQLLSEPSEDGGWPSPYEPGWRPLATAFAMVTLARLRDGA